MVITGTLNTISASLQLARPALNKVCEWVYFEHYYVQTLFMMLGETMCFGAYYFMKYVVNKKNPDALDGNAKPMNPLLLFPASLLDIVGTSLGYVGLGFLRDPGFFQMLRTTPIVFCGLLSIPILKQRLKWFQWTGIMMIVIGIVIKSIPSVIEMFSDEPEDLSIGDACVKKMNTSLYEFQDNWEIDMDGQYGRCAFNIGNYTYHNNYTILLNNESFYEAPINYPTVSQLYHGYQRKLPKAEEEEETLSQATSILIGIAFVVVGEFFHGCQFVYEEKFVVEYDLHPLKVVGIEGTFGVLFLAVALWPAYFITIPKSGILGGIALGPEGRFEDAIDAFTMIFDGGQIWLLGWTIGNMCSISVFNYAGISVTKELSATTRAVLDQIRLVAIWLIFMIPMGAFLCDVQGYFAWTGLVGLFIVICGVWMYNDVIIMPLIRKVTGTGKSSAEKSETDSNNE